jgi:hypothetical protein
MPRTCGLCGSSSVSTRAWCLRWTATHSRVFMPVVSQSQKPEVARGRVQLERAMCLAAVQVDGDGDDGDVSERERRDDVAPPRQVEQAVEQSIPGHGRDA